MSVGFLIMLVTIFVAGCWIGRWLHRCVLRFPKAWSLRDQLRSVWRKGDCRSCGAWESGVQHIPVIGWCCAGRCRRCGRKMDVRRPAVEILPGLLLVWLYWVEIPDYAEFAMRNSGLWTVEKPPGPEGISDLWSPILWLHLRYLLHAVMLCGLMVATVIDFELCIIPDGCTVPAMLFAVLFSCTVGQVWIVPLWFQDPTAANAIRAVLPEHLKPLMFEWDAISFANAHPHWHGLLVSLAGLIMAAVTWGVRAVGFWVLKMEAMGDGDVVLMALIGAVIGWQPALIAFFLAPLLAVPAAVVIWAMRRGQNRLHYFPYGPWLSLATIVLLLAWQLIWPRVSPVFDWGLVLFGLGLVMMGSMAALLQIMKSVKRLMGIEGPNFEAESEWTSADQLSYYGSERPDVETGLWSLPQWPGGRSGRGLSHYHDWRHPAA